MVTPCPTPMDEATLLVAMCDYVAGVCALQCQGYRFFTEHEAVMGVPEFWVNPINPKTSVGPPFAQKKFLHYAREGEAGALSPEMVRRADDLEAVFEAGQIPGIFARCVLKDEAVKPDKAARVFTILSATTNTWLVRILGPLRAFMRANFSFFESAVGVDMSSEDCMRIVEHLRGVQQALDRVEEADATKLDKSWKRQLWDAVGFAFSVMGWALGLDARQVHAAMMALKYCKYELKGDVFASGWNPSGQAATVEVNGVGVSIGDRYVYYRTRPHLVAALLHRCLAFRDALFTDAGVSRSSAPDPEWGFSYRADRALVTYGDDNLGANRPGVERDPDAERLWREEVGIVMTDASKTERVQVRPLRDASFLKRGFVWNEELQRYVCPISLKTIAKMLVCTGDTTLSA